MQSIKVEESEWENEREGEESQPVQDDEAEEALESGHDGETEEIDWSTVEFPVWRGHRGGCPPRRRQEGRDPWGNACHTL